jgi:hypothetical protein
MGDVLEGKAVEGLQERLERGTLQTGDDLRAQVITAIAVARIARALEKSRIEVRPWSPGQLDAQVVAGLSR